MQAIICGNVLGAPRWVSYAMEGHSVWVAKLLALRDRVMRRA